ncbi:MAG: D-cysteine desulfhydrase family protein [Gammaproteobacteria bacterium]|nr:D-cysteine desulfhydrase family protein [Gammaproteobacteria bacterium]
MALVDFPRVQLTHTPTPLEPLPNLTQQLGGPRLFVKRDDCTGLAMGGNKARQLEYYLGQAMAENADTVLITGAVQSNFLRMTAAAAAKLGLRCEIQLEDRVPNMGADYHSSGNVLLHQILGCTVHSFAEGENEKAADAALETMAYRIRADGGRPYVIHLSQEHPPIGALGYVDAAREILEQTAQTGTKIDLIVIPSGSALTHVGTLVGLRLLGSALPVLGICVRRDQKQQTERVLRRANETAELLGKSGIIKPDDVWVSDRVLAPGYGQVNEQTTEAILLAARSEGLLLDPVYSGKTLAGLISLTRDDIIQPHWNVLFVHTGGTPALFGYQSLLAPNSL